MIFSPLKVDIRGFCQVFLQRRYLVLQPFLGAKGRFKGFPKLVLFISKLLRLRILVLNFSLRGLLLLLQRLDYNMPFGQVSFVGGELFLQVLICICILLPIKYLH